MSYAADQPPTSATRRRAQVVAARVHTPAPAAVRPQYQGLVTRGIALALDAALINLVAVTVGVAVALILSALGLRNDFDPIAAEGGGAAYVLWSIGYFTMFWSSTGQTPGNRLMEIRVVKADDGGVLSARRALLRFAALVLAALPLFAGFLPILVNDRRRGLHDALAGTVVVDAPRAAEAAVVTPPAARQ